MNEAASEIAQAISTAAAALCQLAAGVHTGTKSDQRDFAGVLWADANNRFRDVFRKMDPKLQAEFEAYIVRMCKGK